MSIGLRKVMRESQLGVWVVRVPAFVEWLDGVAIVVVDRDSRPRKLKHRMEHPGS